MPVKLLKVLGMLACAAVITVVTAGIAVAGINGKAKLLYGQYSSAGGGQDAGASYFLQQYEATWNSQGTFLGNRGGEYRLSVGYEWNSLSARWDGEQERQVDAGKLLYEGYARIAPGGLPFRLMMYSWDRKRTLLQYDTVHKTNVGVGDNFTNGERVETGAQLLIGIKNGSYLGSYRDMLSQFPRVLLDFKQVYVKDLKSLVPSHFLQRDLAFVSLNKKDNWFHYRFSDYRDLTGLPDSRENDYTNQEYLLGTIDHLRNRQWINLTNWIKLSADGSLNVFKTKISAYPLQTYQVNGFSQMRTGKLHVSEFANFEREREGERVAYRASIPIYWEYSQSSNLFWRGNIGLTNRKDQENLAANIKSEQVKTSRVYLEIRQYQNVSYQFDLSGEQTTRSDGEYWYAVYSMRAQNRKQHFGELGWAADFRISRYQNDNGSYLTEQSLSLSANKEAGRWRLSGSENIAYGSGSIDSGDKDAQGQTTTDLQGNSMSRSGGTWKSMSSAAAETVWFGVLDRFELGYAVEKTAKGTSQAYSANHSAKIDKHNFVLDLGNSYNSELARDSFSSNDSTLSVNNTQGWQLQNQLAFRWVPLRNVSFGMRAEHNYMHSTSPLNVYKAEQSLLYKGTTSNGVVRTLYSIEQTLSSEKYKQTGNFQSDYQRNEFGITTNYFPTSHIDTGMLLRYNWKQSNDDAVFYVGTHVKLRYQLLSAGLSYYRSYNIASNVVEQRWEAVVNKSF